MLTNLRRWLERVFSAETPPTAEQARAAVATSRHDRAGSIDDLQKEVRRLQQEIKDASDALEGLEGEQRVEHEGRLASLHADLERKQKELSRFQARV